MSARMKKNLLFVAIFVLIAGVADMLCALLAKDTKSTCFGISIGFINGVLVLAAVFAATARDYNKGILAFGPLYLSLYLVIVSSVMNFLFIVCGMTNVTVDAVLNVLVTCLFLIPILIHVFANVDTYEQDKEIIDSTKSTATFKNDVKALINVSGNVALSKQIESVYDALCSAQVISNGADTAVYDKTIAHSIYELSEAVNGGDERRASQLCTEIKSTITEKNNAIASRQH